MAVTWLVALSGRGSGSQSASPRNSWPAISSLVLCSQKDLRAEQSSGFLGTKATSKFQGRCKTAIREARKCEDYWTG